MVAVNDFLKAEIDGSSIIEELKIQPVIDH